MRVSAAALPRYPPPRRSPARPGTPRPPQGLAHGPASPPSSRPSSSSSSPPPGSGLPAAGWPRRGDLPAARLSPSLLPPLPPPRGLSPRPPRFGPGAPQGCACGAGRGRSPPPAAAAGPSWLLAGSGSLRSCPPAAPGAARLLEAGPGPAAFERRRLRGLLPPLGSPRGRDEAASRRPEESGRARRGKEILGAPPRGCPPAAHPRASPCAGAG